MIRPSRLRPGARIALVAPAGPLDPGAIERACERVRSLGWEPLVGAHADRRTEYLAGTDDERLDDLARALAPGACDAIWCLRGGYGTMRIATRLDLSGLVADPRPLIGFSDNTVLHLLARKVGVVTFHGPHAAVSDFPDFTRERLLASVERSDPGGPLPMPGQTGPRPTTLVPGIVEGPLLGGNLSLLAATAGTPYQLEASGAILFFEEVGESMYRIDRLLTQLSLTGMLDAAAGIMVGSISECPDEDAGARSVEDILRDRLGNLSIPVAMGFPFGHVPDTWTLPVGVRARLDAGEGTCEILEGAVTN